MPTTCPSSTRLLRDEKPAVVINVALPYQDLHIMDACLEAGVDYLDTANYEPLDVAKFEYKWQWAYQDRFAKAGRMALLGSGFDPGMTNVFCAYVQKHLLDEIHYVDIVDCNAGSHGKAFATNFNPEINIREITARGRYWEHGEWKETDPLSVSRIFDYPGVGEKKSFLLYHEELESLAKNLKGLKRIRFWMTFGESYLKHLEVMQNIGMTRIDPVEFDGQQDRPDPVPARAASGSRHRSRRATPARPRSAACARASRTASRSATSSTTSATTPRPTRRSAPRRSRTRPACRR